MAVHDAGTLAEEVPRFLSVVRSHHRDGSVIACVAHRRVSHVHLNGELKELGRYKWSWVVYQFMSDSNSITERQWEIITGMVLGDCCIDTEGAKNVRIIVTDTNRSYLEWIGSEFPNESGEISVMEKDGQNKNDLCRLNIFSNPNLNILREVRFDRSFFTQNNRLTPLSAKVWYAGDGSLGWRNGSAQVQIGVSDNDRQKNYIGLLEEVGFESNQDKNQIYFVNGDGQRFLNWMGSPSPGYEYKWMTESRERYNELREMVYENV